MRLRQTAAGWGALSAPEYVISSFHAGIRWDVAKTRGKGTEGSSSLYKQTTSLKKKKKKKTREREGREREKGTWL
jgi:hypothetical protein